MRGGSTITQQLAKNLFFTTHKTITRKLRELVVARWMEEDCHKRRILELYLNVIEWGDGIYGAEAAARRWYGKAAADLDAHEAAGLAAMIPNPRRINPPRRRGALRARAAAGALADGARRGPRPAGPGRGAGAGAGRGGGGRGRADEPDGAPAAAVEARAHARRARRSADRNDAAPRPSTPATGADTTGAGPTR